MRSEDFCGNIRWMRHGQKSHLWTCGSFVCPQISFWWILFLLKRFLGTDIVVFFWKGWKHIKVIHAELCRASTNLILNYFLFVDIWHVLVLVAAPKMVFCQGYSTCPGWDIIQLSQTNILQKEMHFFIDLQYRWDSKWSNQAFNCGERLHHTALHLLNKTCHRSMQELRHAMSCWNSNGLLNVATQ